MSLDIRQMLYQDLLFKACLLNISFNKSDVSSAIGNPVRTAPIAERSIELRFALAGRTPVRLSFDLVEGRLRQ